MVRDGALRAPPHHEAGESAALGTVSELHPSDLILRSPSHKRGYARLRRAMARASRRMAPSPNLLPWFETARIAAKCTQAAPAMACLLTMRLRVGTRARPPKLKGSHALSRGRTERMLFTIK